MSKEKIKETLSQQQPEEQEIDLIELARKIWAEHRLIFKWCSISVVLGLIIAFSIPKEYSTEVKLAPEAKGKSAVGSSMGALAAMAGINLGTSSGEDALSPELYPDIVSSTPFLIELFNVQVEDVKGKYRTTLYTYLDEHQRSPWWSSLFSFPFKVLGWGMSLFKDKPEEKEEVLNPFKLTSDQTQILKALNSRISISIDKKTGITTLSVLMQDPLISATLTDTVMVKLQNYITEYRTNKAKRDLDFIKILYKEAKENYYNAQVKYAQNVDGNLNVTKLTSKAEQDRLKDEMSLAYNVYNQVAQQLQTSKAKVQEITPVYTVVQPATVPLQASKPNKIMILIGFIFLATIGSIGWILFFKDFFNNWKKKEKSNELHH